MSGYENDFFQTGRNSAEARFWKLKIHEEVDRRQAKSSIVFDGNDGNADEAVSNTGSEENRKESPSPGHGGYKWNKARANLEADSSSDYKYSYALSQTDFSKDYRYTSISIVSTMRTRMNQFLASKDYQYSYPRELEEEDELEQKGERVDSENRKANEEGDKLREDFETRDESGKYFVKAKPSLKSLYEENEGQSPDHISSRFY